MSAKIILAFLLRASIIEDDNRIIHLQGGVQVPTGGERPTGRKSATAQALNRCESGTDSYSLDGRRCSQKASFCASLRQYSGDGLSSGYFCKGVYFYVNSIHRLLRRPKDPQNCRHRHALGGGHHPHGSGLPDPLPHPHLCQDGLLRAARPPGSLQPRAGQRRGCLSG